MLRTKLLFLGKLLLFLVKPSHYQGFSQKAFQKDLHLVAEYFCCHWYLTEQAPHNFITVEKNHEAQNLCNTTFVEIQNV